MTKKIISVILCLCTLSLCFVACADGTVGGENTTEEKTTEGLSQAESDGESTTDEVTTAEVTTAAPVYNEEELSAMNEMLSENYKGYELPIGGWATPASNLREIYSGDPTSYDRAYQLLADSGINFMITLEEWSSATWHMESLSSANKAGIKLWYNCVAMDPADSLAKINEMLASENAEALSGIYYQDEPGIGDIDYVATGHAAIKEGLGANNKLPVFSNLLPMYATTAMVGADYRAYVKTYIEKTKPDILMYDYYPFQGATGDSLPSMMANIAILRDEANAAGGIDLYTFLQSSQHAGLREPSVEELRVNAHINLAMGVKGFAYFLACEHYENWGYGHMINYEGEITPLYDKIKTVNGELAGFKGAFLGFENKGIMLAYPDAETAIEKVSDTMVLESFGSIKEFKAQGRQRSKAMVGCFEDEEGREGYYLVNASYSTSDTLILNFDEPQSFVIWTAEGASVLENTSKVEVKLGKGDAAFVVKFDVNKISE